MCLKKTGTKMPSLHNDTAKWSSKNTTISAILLNFNSEVCFKALKRSDLFCVHDIFVKGCVFDYENYIRKLGQSR